MKSMNDTMFDQRIAAAFAVLPCADVYLKNRLLNLPDEVKKPAVARKLLPLAGALAAVAAIGIAIPLLGKRPPQPPIDLPPISLGSIYSSDGMAGMGYEAHMNKTAAELHRDSPAYGREGEIGTMAVYRNPQFEQRHSLDEARAKQIAEQFGKAVGKTYTYEPPRWLTRKALEQVREKLRAVGDTEEEIERTISEQFTQTDWQFKYGDEELSVSGYYAPRVSLIVPLPDLPPDRITDPARYETLCQQVYENYAAAIEELTGLRFNKASTAFDYNIYGEEHIETFFYVNNPGDSLAKQAEDYALKRLDVSIPFASMAEIADGYDEKLVAYMGFNLSYPGAEELLDDYPVMDPEAAKRELLDGRYEASVQPTKEELARATIEEAELIYSDRPWLSTWMPMYRLYVTFQPGDMQDWNNNNPHLERLGLRNYYVFYVPAVPSAYLVPQQKDGSMPRPVG